jgi:hypothetical protein
MKHFLTYLAVSIIAILAPIKALILTVGFLIIADLITGIWASHKRKEKIRSSVMRRTISKAFVYQLAVISGFLVETYLLESFFPVSKVVASVIGLVELKSILENSNSILGYNLFKTVIEKLGSENDNLKTEIIEQAKAEVKKQLE